MAKYVRIQSTRPIVVTGGLQAINMTDENSTEKDRLKVQQKWTAFRVQIERGTGYYPSRIKDWSSVKTLSEKQILTIGEETDVIPNTFTPEQIKKFEDTANNVEYEYSKYEKQADSFKRAKEAKNAKPASPKNKKEETLFDEEQ